MLLPRLRCRLRVLVLRVLLRRHAEATSPSRARRRELDVLDGALLRARLRRGRVPSAAGLALQERVRLEEPGQHVAEVRRLALVELDAVDQLRRRRRVDDAVLGLRELAIRFALRSRVVASASCASASVARFAAFSVSESFSASIASSFSWRPWRPSRRRAEPCVPRRARPSRPRRASPQHRPSASRPAASASAFSFSAAPSRRPPPRPSSRPRWAPRPSRRPRATCAARRR
jgi:hypothetical protein